MRTNLEMLIASIKKFDYNGLLLEDDNVALSHLHLQLVHEIVNQTDRIK